ncbi:RNase H family protein [Falsihalocynthiibacter arcticus]|uniref:RNase H type-1 domain-containing protein n=1 Tax=Falsihalocynthiibacter arcticus TaxID=1579316 RepID=A0A126V354_9RHOB|nr:RNase H family protein [Falsihalocynthiibacter arcticus]AML52748.1 hypothetical protein RC74_17105 [Falsihalocynthiibacter arcticus]
MTNKDETAQAEQVTMAYAIGSQIAKTKAGGWGCAVLHPSFCQLTVMEENGRSDATTAPRENLWAALGALEMTPKEIPLVVYMCDHNTINACNGGIPKLKANGWRNSGNKRPLNQDILERIEAAMKGRKVQFKSFKKGCGGMGERHARRLAAMAIEGQLVSSIQIGEDA